MRNITEQDIMNRARVIAEAHAQMPWYSVSDFLMIREQAIKELSGPIFSARSQSRDTCVNGPVPMPPESVPAYAARDADVHTAQISMYGQIAAGEQGSLPDAQKRRRVQPPPVQQGTRPVQPNGAQSYNNNRTAGPGGQAPVPAGTPAANAAPAPAQSTFDILRNAGDKWN